ncbi:hypothetical protein RDI58_022213 [Solanum bulbocastanum]|uniref:Uncharacterized protein n=1 Tax=Solanum bulbocastanum TaxID=147425 RepID=A0AAN8T292_SOLBU
MQYWNSDDFKKYQ